MSAFVEAVEAALLRLARGRAPAALRLLAGHAAQIIAMRSDGTADLAMDDESVGGPGGLGGRAVLVGLPGVRLDLRGGDRGRLAFEGGSPAGGEVHGFEQDRGADRGLARKGERVRVGSITIVKNENPAPPGLTLTFTPQPSPFDLVPAIPSTLLILGSLNIDPSPFTIDLDGWVMTGSPEVALRHVAGESTP